MKKIFIILGLLGLGFVFSACQKQEETKETIKLSTPSLVVDNKIVSWSKVDNASKYEIIIDDISYGTTSELSYDFSEYAIGSYNIQVRAMSGNTKEYKNSSLSTKTLVTISPIKLKTPVLFVKNKVVGWNEIKYVDNYEVYLDNTLISTQATTTYTIEPTEYKDYVVSVKAITNKEGYISSDMSNSVTYSYLKKQVPTPVISVSNESATWYTSSRAEYYEVYVNNVFVENNYTGVYKAPNTPGTYKVQVKGISKDLALYENSEMSIGVNVKVIENVDLTKDILVYSKNLKQRLERYVLGILSNENKNNYNVNSYYLERLNYMDNYLCNLVTYNSLKKDNLVNYAWTLEEVTYNNNVSWVNKDYKVYRIKLTDGMYLSVTKNNLINAGGDYISETEYIENDIWQYWQLIPIDGYKNEFYIRNIGNCYDWNNNTLYLTDTSRADGGAELYPMGQYNEYYFHFIIENIEGVNHSNTTYKDLTGKYVVTNFKNNNVYSIGTNDYIVNSTRTLSNYLETDTWELEKVSENRYKIKFSDGSYMCMNNYDLYKTSAANASEFYLYKVSGVSNCYKICGALDNDFCKFNDTNDNTTRRYCYSDTEKNGIASRWWNSIDHRNDLGNYWIFNAVL